MAGDSRLSLVRIGMNPDSKERLFRDVVRALHEDGRIPETETPLESLLAREEVSSTAMGRGIALPHARCPVCTELCVSAVRLREPLEFGAPDGDPVDLVFFILGPEEPPGEHVMLLGRIARLVSRPGALEALRSAPDESTFRALVDEGLVPGQV
jgi:mannitol/fructose-specific phosphotransferase system IIA component (Ntr-type)